jgi:hypothetical protein
MSSPICSNKIENLDSKDFLCFDKDGFELNSAEMKYYSAMNHPLNYCLNHTCYQETWFESLIPEIIVDHSLILHRCYYDGEAKEQLNSIKYTIPQASHLLNLKPKWGFDFALDSIDPEKNLFEVIHIEYDNKNYSEFIEHMVSIDYVIRHTDWVDAANRILANKDKWQHLHGFEQNNWKAKFLIGWTKAEYTEKV